MSKNTEGDNTNQNQDNADKSEVMRVFLSKKPTIIDEIPKDPKKRRRFYTEAEFAYRFKIQLERQKIYIDLNKPKPRSEKKVVTVLARSHNVIGVDKRGNPVYVEVPEEESDW